MIVVITLEFCWQIPGKEYMIDHVQMIFFTEHEICHDKTIKKNLHCIQFIRFISAEDAKTRDERVNALGERSVEFFFELNRND